MASPEQQGVCGDEVGGPRTEPSPTRPPNVLGGTDTARMGNYLLPVSPTPDPGPKAGEGMLALYCTSLANGQVEKWVSSFHRGFSMSLLKRDRGTWQVRGRGALSADCSLRGCTHDVVRDPPKSREPWTC